MNKALLLYIFNQLWKVHLRKLPNETLGSVIVVRRGLMLSKIINYHPSGWAGLPKGRLPREYWGVTLLVVEADCVV